MKKVLILAYTTLNLGDDIFVDMLCKRYKDTEFYIVMEKRFAKAFKNIDNLTIIYSRTKYLDLILHKLGIPFSFDHYFKKRLAKKLDMTINIGGSLFQENKGNWIKAAERYKELVDVSEKFYLIGANFGPYISKEYYDFYFEVFSKIEQISFRDNISYSLFSRLENSQLAPDIILGLDYKFKEINKMDSDYFVISVINLENREDLSKYTYEYENTLEKLGRELLKKGYKVVLMSFCEHEGDIVAIDRITKSNPDFGKYLYNGNISEALSIIAASKGVVATRLHSLILAIVNNLSVFSIIYNSKISNIIDDYHFECDNIEIQNISEIDIESVIEKLLTTTVTYLEDYKIKSETHFSELDKELNS